MVLVEPMTSSVLSGCAFPHVGTSTSVGPPSEVWTGTQGLQVHDKLPVDPVPHFHT